MILVTKYLVTKEACDYYNSNGVGHSAFRKLHVTLWVNNVDLKIFSGLCDTEK